MSQYRKLLVWVYEGEEHQYILQQDKAGRIFWNCYKDDRLQQKSVAEWCASVLKCPRSYLLASIRILPDATPDERTEINLLKLQLGV